MIKSFKQITEDTWYHGSGTFLGDKKLDKPLYMTKDRGEARGFAKHGHLGGSGSGTFVHHYFAKKGKTINIDNHINKAMERGDFDKSVITKHIAKAIKSGHRYVEFTHPGFSGKDFTTRVSLHPSEDLKLKGWTSE